MTGSLLFTTAKCSHLGHIQLLMHALTWLHIVLLHCCTFCFLQMWCNLTIVVLLSAVLDQGTIQPSPFMPSLIFLLFFVIIPFSAIYLSIIFFSDSNLKCDCGPPAWWFILCRLWVLGWRGRVEEVSFWSLFLTFFFNPLTEHICVECFYVTFVNLKWNF